MPSPKAPAAPNVLPLADWTHRTADIPERGLEMARAATPAEREELRAALDVLACDRFEAAYRVRPMAGGRYEAKGSFLAEVTQACIVTLEPVAATINEPFEEEFWPGELMSAAEAEGEAEEREALGVETPEFIQQGVIDIGRLIYEHLATALDPYPRAQGASFDWAEPEAPQTGNPFAALSALKDPK